MDHIKAIHDGMAGLVLHNDRRITWHIAALMLANGEIEISDKVRTMLREKLAIIPSAAEFLKVL